MTIEELRSLVFRMKLGADEDTAKLKPWWFALEPPFNDFNREIVQPGTNEHYPDGAVGIRADDDFWTVGVLPLSAQNLTIQQIVQVLWPDIYPEADFGPDSERIFGN